MRKIFLPYCICIFLTGMSVAAHAAAVTPAYKLGQSYSSETTTSANCLEGYAGANLNDSKCKDISSECKSNTDCTNRFGKNWVCAKGRYTYAKSGVCRYQECSGTGDTSCSTKYSHMRSCVLNESGYYECRITCNWEKIKGEGKACLTDSCNATGTTKTNIGIVDRIQFEYNLWQNPSGVSLSSGSKFMTDISALQTVSNKWYTCINGRVSPCLTPNLSTTMKSTDWNNGKNDGYQYKPCLPCSIATGGTYGIGTDEDISHVGNYAYSSSLWNMSVGEDFSYDYLKTSANLYGKVSSTRCGNAGLYLAPSLMYRLNSSFPMATRQNQWGTYLGRIGLSGAVDLGSSDVCLTWHRRTNTNSRYVSGNTQKGYCSGKDDCLQTTDMELLTWVPQTNTSWKLSSAVTRGTTVTVNFNRTYGTLLCCRFGQTDTNADIDWSNRFYKGCVAINPAQ